MNVIKQKMRRNSNETLIHILISGHARTNNSVEGWNRRFSSLIGADHPSLWKFIEKLKLEQSHTEFRLNQAAAGVQPAAKRLKYRDLNARLITKVREYNPNSLADYLIGIAHNISFHV